LPSKEIKQPLATGDNIHVVLNLAFIALSQEILMIAPHWMVPRWMVPRWMVPRWMVPRWMVPRWTVPRWHRACWNLLRSARE
jgi:hypothetical protein